MTKILVSGSISVLLDQICAPRFFFPQFYFYYMLDIVTSYGSMQFQGKLMNQTWENSEKPSFRTDFDPFSPNLDSKSFFINFTSTTFYVFVQAIIAWIFKKN